MIKFECEEFMTHLSLILGIYLFSNKIALLCLFTYLLYCSIKWLHFSFTDELFYLAVQNNYIEVYLLLFYFIILQAKLQEFLGRKELDRHLDADEAIVLGAALHAANLSDGIKLNRKIGMVDGSLYGFVVELSGLDLLKDESSRQLLVPRMKKLPSKVNQLMVYA